MGNRQFARTVRGTDGIVATNQTGTMETNDYPNGDDVVIDPNNGDSYPVSVNPAETIHEIIVNSAGDVQLEVHTIDGDVINMRLDGASGAYNRWKVDKFVVSDPRSTGALFSGGWAGE